MRNPKNAGFRAYFWKRIGGLSNVAQGIRKIARKTPSLTQRVYNIQYKNTGGHFKGLNGQYKTNFVARFKGHLRVMVSGKYTFWTASDDGSKLYIDGKLVVNNDGLHGMRSRTGRLHLSKGVKIIVVDFFQRGGGKGLKVDWAGPGFGKRPIDGKNVEMKPREEVLAETADTAGTSGTSGIDIKTMEAKVAQAVRVAVGSEREDSLDAEIRKLALFAQKM